MDYFWVIPLMVVLAVALVCFFLRIAGRNRTEPSRLDEALRESRSSEPRR